MSQEGRGRGKPDESRLDTYLPRLVHTVKVSRDTIDRFPTYVHIHVHVPVLGR